MTPWKGRIPADARGSAYFGPGFSPAEVCGQSVHQLRAPSPQHPLQAPRNHKAGFRFLSCLSAGKPSLPPPPLLRPCLRPGIHLVLLSCAPCEYVNTVFRTTQRGASLEKEGIHIAAQPIQLCQACGAAVSCQSALQGRHPSSLAQGSWSLSLLLKIHDLFWLLD